MLARIVALRRLPSDREPRECCEETEGRSDLSVVVGTTWRKIREALADAQGSRDE